MIVILQAAISSLCALLFCLVVVLGVRREEGEVWCGRCGHPSGPRHRMACPICGSGDWRAEGRSGGAGQSGMAG